MKTDATLGAKGTSILIVETHDLPGYAWAASSTRSASAPRTRASSSSKTCGCRLSCLLGATEGKGFAQLMSDLPYERMIVAVQAVAAMEGALEETVRYVKGRKAFGKTLLEFQNTRFRLAEAATIVRVARTFIDRCIHGRRRRQARCGHRLDGQVVEHGHAATGARRVRAAARRLRLHE